MNPTPSAPNYFDDEEPVRLSVPELARVDKLVGKLQDCDLADWDRTFVEDMRKRLTRYQRSTRISGEQYKQLERMEYQYL